MPAVGYSEGLERIRKGAKGASCWLLVTDDSMLLTQASQAMADAVVPDYRDFNYQRLDCGDRRDEERLSVGRCVAECEELPMMADRRLVWLRDVDKLKEQLPRLAQYLADVPPSTVLFMSGFSQEGASFKTLVTAAQRVGVVIQGTLSSGELGAWLAEQASARGLEMSADVLTRFRERVGEDASMLDSEMDKLACYVGERRTVTLADVQAITTWNPSAKTWELTDAVRKRDVDRALQLVSTLLADDLHPLIILAMLGTQFREMLKIKALEDRRMSVSSIAATLKKKEYPVRLGLEAARKLSYRELENRIDMLLRADQAMKSGKDGRLVLELLIVRLAR